MCTKLASSRMGQAVKLLVVTAGLFLAIAVLLSPVPVSAMSAVEDEGTTFTFSQPGATLPTSSLTAELSFFDVVRARQAAIERVELQVRAGRAPMWVHATVEDAILMYDLSGEVTAYLFQVRQEGLPAGYLTVAALDIPNPVLEFATQGTHPLTGGLSHIKGQNLPVKSRERPLYLGLLSYGYELESQRDLSERQVFDLLSAQIRGVSAQAANIPLRSRIAHVALSAESLTIISPEGPDSTKLIGGVPDYNQFDVSDGCPSGCSPTAAINALGYWDQLGYVEPREWANLINGTDWMAAVNEMRMFMGTECENGQGWTLPDRIAPGIIAYAAAKGYDFDSEMLFDSTATFSRYQGEIDALRPVVVSFDDSYAWSDFLHPDPIDHSTTGVGYQTEGPYIIVHDNMELTPQEKDVQYGTGYSHIQMDTVIPVGPLPPADAIPPTASWVSPSNGQDVTTRTVSLEANVSDDSSGVKEVRFSAKYNGAWNGLAVDTSAPYVFDWDMCSYGVPDGDVELGLEATDNAGNKYVYSSDHANIHINKSYNCNTPPPQGCAAPTLIAPSDGETLGSRTITFSWNPVSGCSFNGYTFRVCTSSDVETLSNCFIDSGEGSTQRTETITDHDNMDLWWGVKAANASAGSSWAVRRFTINPAAANGQWNASYFNTRTCWDDHNNCNGTTFNETLYVPGGGTLIDKNYGSSSPGGSIGSDNWTGRYEGTFNFATGNYVFYADHDDGLKLNIWNYGEHTKDSSGTNSVICNGNGGYFLSGDMPIRLYLREDGGDAKIKLRWSTDTSVCGSGSGGGVTGGSWSADYFNTRTCWDDHNNCNGTTYHDSPSFPGADTLIDKNWGQSSPGGGIGPDNWTGRFINTFNFLPAKYVFYADHDDGLKLQFGSYGEHTKDSSGSNSMICDGADGYYLSGNQQVKLYLREDGGDARVKLRWNTDTTACLPVPSAPTGVVASDGTYSDHIRVTWNAASYATVYEVWRNSTNNSATAAVIHNYVTATSYDDAYIVPGQTYYYWIKAKNSKGTSGFSASDSGFASVPPPAAPTGVSASDGDYTDNVLVTWLAVPGATSYEVWRNTADNSSSATQIAAAVNGTSYADTTVSIGQTYYYWTKARNVSGAGPFSTSDSGYAIVPAPTAPTGVTATDGAYVDRVRVNWLAVPGATQYEVWRNTISETNTASRIVQNATGTEYEDVGTTSDQIYFYWIKAKNGGGTSSFSATDSGYSQAPAPTAVSDLAAATSASGALLVWTHTDPAIGYYRVYRSENPYFVPGQGDSVKLEPDTTAPAIGAQASYTDSVMCPGDNTPCFYAVVGVSQYGKAAEASNRIGIFSFTVVPGSDPQAPTPTPTPAASLTPTVTPTPTSTPTSTPTPRTQWELLGFGGIGVLTVEYSPLYTIDQTILASAYDGTVSGLYRSVDAGATWQKDQAWTGAAWDIVFSPNYASDSTLFAATDAGDFVRRSTNGGTSWVVQGPSSEKVRSLSISPDYADDQTVFAGTFSGHVYRTLDRGATWTDQGLLKSTSYQVRALAVSPNFASDRTVFAGLNPGGGVYRSTDAGNTWTAVNSGLPSQNIAALAISPDYANDQMVLVTCWNGGVYRSVDGGSTWAAANTGQPNRRPASGNTLVFSPDYLSDHTLFYATWGENSDGGVYRSINGAASWEYYSDGLGTRFIHHLSLSPDFASQPGILAGGELVNGGGLWVR